MRIFVFKTCTSNAASGLLSYLYTVARNLRLECETPELKDSFRVESSLIVEDVIAFLLSLVPFLNAGTLTLIVDLGFQRLGFRITRREFRKEPMKSLFWALCLVFIGSVVAVIIQTRLSGLEPLLVLLILIVAYLALTQV